jgi:ABC-type lipoprotein export system ATPase subunit
LIGTSGDGKSTLLNYIGKAKQVAIDNYGVYKIENVEPLPGIKTSHGI